MTGAAAKRSPQTAQGRNILDLIGNTPLIEATHLDTGPCRLFLKLESANPGGSIKDRPALTMIEAFERDGTLQPGGTLIEATAGNTGLGLALVASQKGYRLILVIPDKMSREKIFHLRAMGAEIIMTRSDVGKGHPDYYQDMAQRIADETPGAVYVNQFANHANPLAHETTTAPEIWEQMDHDVDAVVCGIGSGGTMAGFSRYFAKVSPATEMILADPEGSILADVVAGKNPREPGSWLVEGVGEDFIPSIADLSRIKKAYTIGDREAFEVARDLLKKEGVLGGSSTGTLVAAALRYCREQTMPRRVVALVCDSGNKYLSKMYNDYWMQDQGLMDRPEVGDLRDLVSRRYDEGAAVTVNPEDTLNTAWKRMKLYDVSQLPVIENDRPVAVIDESDLLVAVSGDPKRFSAPVRSAMSKSVETVRPDADIPTLLDIFNKGYVAMVADGAKFYGVITRIDVINHLRRKFDLS
jgi:cystathionine beta-synthase